jgi:hypothetical protein
MNRGLILYTIKLTRMIVNLIFLLTNKSAQSLTHDMFQGQITSAYGGALFTFLLLLKYSSSPSLRFGVPARLARRPL